VGISVKTPLRPNRTRLVRYAGFLAKKAGRIAKLGYKGGMTPVHPGSRLVELLDSIRADCLYGLRGLRLNRGFSAAIIVTLAIGIGATTAVFTVVNSVALRPLKIPHSDRVVVLQSTSPKEGTSFTVAEGVFLDWRERSRSFERIAGAWSTPMIFGRDGQPRQVAVIKATADVFDIAGLHLLDGSPYDSSAEHVGKDRVAILDDGFCRREFGGTDGIVGQQIRLDDDFYVVAGIVRSGFSLGSLRSTDIWVPFAPVPTHRSGGPVTVIARLRPGIAVTAAQAEMTTIHDEIRKEHPEDSAFGVGVVSVRDWVIGSVRPTLILLSGAVCVLLIMCCVNIANILLARGSVRQREYAVRASLGGSRWRIARQLITENLVLASAGGIVGLLVAVLLIRVIPYIGGLELPRIGEVRPDGGMLLIAACVTVASCILFGALPAFQDSTTAYQARMSAAGVAEPVTPGAMRLRRSLVVVQIGLSLMLLSSAGLLLNSFARLTSLELGFSRADVIAAEINLPNKRYDSKRGLAFYRRLIEEVRVLPGVVEVSAADYLPLQPVLYPIQVVGEGATTKSIEAMARHADRSYFRVLGIPMLAGREFEPADDKRSPVPVVLNAEAARRLFGGTQDAIGRHLSTNYGQTRFVEVVGVTSNVRQLGLRQDPGPQIYMPLKLGTGNYLIARTAPNTGDLSGAIRAATFRLDPTIPAPEVSTVRTWYEREIAQPRAYLFTVGVFAFIGLVIAGTGIYGLIAFTVSRRTHEFGVRLALGAQSWDILRSVLSRESLPIVGGLMVGSVGAVWAGRLLTSMLYEVRPQDLPTNVGCIVLLACIAALGCYLPARRAMRLDPATALRNE
jgi:putative ABC transport system permease protein